MKKPTPSIKSVGKQKEGQLRLNTTSLWKGSFNVLADACGSVQMWGMGVVQQ